jgi:hypothetical protein
VTASIVPTAERKDILSGTPRARRGMPSPCFTERRGSDCYLTPESRQVESVPDLAHASTQSPRLVVTCKDSVPEPDGGRFDATRTPVPKAVYNMEE